MVTARYVAGQTIPDALNRLHEIVARGHSASAEYAGDMNWLISA